MVHTDRRIKNMRVHESETVEFKKSLSQTEPALKAVCGFLNYHGGIISFEKIQ